MDFSKMTLREKVFQTIIAPSRCLKQAGSIEEFFKKYPVGGIYYAKHCGAPDLAALMESGTAGDEREYILACKKASRYPLIVCADSANIDDDGLDLSCFSALGATRDEDLAYRLGRARGMQMNYNHIDWILGPCIDLNKNRINATISSSMTDDPILNGKIYSAVVRGIQDEHVAATVKHFPGLGTYHVNFHHGPGKNTMNFDEWLGSYGYSYLECFKADAQVVMTSHLSLPAYAPDGEDGLPPICTYSKKLTIELLKEKLGFKGAVVTDALCMGGQASGDQVVDAVNAFIHGADFLLWPPMEAGERITEMLEKGEIPMSRLEDALSRIERVRKFLGIMDHDRVEMPVDKKFVDDTFREISRRGLELVRNKNNVFPLDRNKYKKILLIGNAPDDGAFKQIEPMADLLREKGFEVKFQRYLLSCWEDVVIPMYKDFDLVIQIINVPFTVGCFPDCSSTTWAFHLVKKEKRAIVNFSSPYFADDYYPDDPEFITAHQAPNPVVLRDVVNAMVGEIPFEGKSPVKLDC